VRRCWARRAAVSRAAARLSRRLREVDAPNRTRLFRGGLVSALQGCRGGRRCAGSCASPETRSADASHAAHRRFNTVAADKDAAHGAARGEEEAPAATQAQATWVSTNGSDGQSDASGTPPKAPSSRTAPWTPTVGGTECVTWRPHGALSKLVTTQVGTELPSCGRALRRACASRRVTHARKHAPKEVSLSVLPRATLRRRAQM
jgi:hypothetical protein